jgi:hypothetical protein
VEIPSDLTGVLLFIVLLLPGFAYNSVRGRRRPARQLTTLQETVVIVIASLVSLAATGLVFAAIRALWPGATPDVRSLIFRPHAYLEAHYVSTAWWSAGFLVVAIVGALGAAALPATAPDPSTMSSWWIAFDGRAEEIHVGCALDDGSYVSGRLASYSQVAEDTADRDLVLRAPLSVRPPGGSELRPLDRAALMTISARHIVTMTVTYVRRPAPAPAPATITS